MEVKDLVPVDYSNQRVLLTAQVAEVFGTSPARIRDNFKHAKKQFQKGVHYFKLEGEELRAARERALSVLKSYAPSPFPKGGNAVILYTEQGVARHCKMLNNPNALEIMERLRVGYFNSKPVMTPQVVEVQGVHGYLDDKGIAWLNVDDVAFKLGISQVKSGVEYVRYERINDWIKEYGFSPEVGKGDFIPEHVVYLLAMKANNETAKTFQMEIATEILPSIRKYGFYSVKPPVETSLFPDEEPVKKVRRVPVPELAVVYAVLLSNMLVKIGMTRDLTARMKDLQKETKADILAWTASALMTRDEAILLERCLKAKFFDKLVSGEFFNVDFDTVKAALTAPADTFNRLLALAEKINSPDEKDKLLIRAADLLK